VLTFVAVIVVAYAAVAGLLYVFQRSFIFLPGGALVSPAEAGLDSVEVVTITMADATLLTGWYAEPRAGRPSVLYFHGNGGNISMRADYLSSSTGWRHV
jgi:hypothetical protein